MRAPPPQPQTIGMPANSPQIKVGWFKEGTLFIQDIGVTFEKITKPGNLLNVQVGQFDALLTVKDMDDIDRIKRAVGGKGVPIKDQTLKEFMIVRDERGEVKMNPSAGNNHPEPLNPPVSSKFDQFSDNHPPPAKRRSRERSPERRDSRRNRERDSKSSRSSRRSRSRDRDHSSSRSRKNSEL